MRDRVTLVEALPALLARVPTARLLVVGHVYYDLFQRQARELGVDHAVLSIGSVDKTAVPDYLAAADRLPRPVHFLTFDRGQIPAAADLGFTVVSPAG